MSTPGDARNIAVVGAGIIGAATALRLILDGHNVTLLDPNKPGSGASYGNAGHIGVASVVPWANPTNRRYALKWMRDPLHPLRMPLTDWPRNSRWLYRWLRASTAQRSARTANVLAEILTTSVTDLKPLLSVSGAHDLLRRDGLLHVFHSSAAYAAAQAGFKQRSQLGIAVRELNATDVRELEPRLSPNVSRAVLLPDVAQVLDPGELVNRFVSAFRTRGGELACRAVQKIEQPMQASPVSLLANDGWNKNFDYAVLAAGISSRRFSQDLGVKVPLQAERGYHLQLNRASELITRSVLFVDHRVVFSPMNEGLRLTTGAEFTDPDAPENHEFVRPIFEVAKALLPNLGNLSDASAWMGSRPSTPDSLPVIGRAPKAPGVILAYGHGHTGLTMAAPTAEIVANLVAGRKNRMNLAPFAPDRPS